ncbi:MAG: DUF6110 family protein [Desulfovibrio sp.]|jgi:hypothetical protein|nr:DUF6110 family protein [Desulfovibrio sp.]
MGSNWWKYGLALGLGVAAGAVGAIVLSRGSVDLKKLAAAALSRGMDLKDKAAAAVETAKENMDDITAEARHIRETRNTPR